MPYRTSNVAAQSCFDKCIMLKRELEACGYICQLMIGNFRWSELNIPQKVMKFCKKDAEKHVYLRVRHSGTDWINLDPTIDQQLGGRFQVQRWDGINSTELLTPLTNIHIYRPFSLWERTKSKVLEMLELNKNDTFYEAFDRWLDEVRQHKEKSRSI